MKKFLVWFAISAIILLSLLPGGCAKSGPTALSRGEGSGIIETSSQSISAAQGGTITLPSGSSVTIPPGLLASDTTVTLTLLSSMSKQPPCGIIQGVGTCLEISFGPLSTSKSVAKLKELAAVSSSGEAEFTIKYSGGTETNLTGSVPMVDIIDSSGNHAFAGVPGGIADSSGGMTAVFQIQAALFKQLRSSMIVSMANLIPSLVGAPDPLAPRIWNGSNWVNYPQGFDPTQKTLLLVHGIFSNVDSAYPCAAAIMAAGGYGQVIGFNYDWTQAAGTTGSSLANFLTTLQTAGLSQIDIEAHSYGGLTVLSGASQSTLQINNIILEGSPISGTPAAGLAQSGIVPWATTFFNMPLVGNVFPSTVNTLNNISNNGFLASLLAGVTSQIPQLLTNHPETEFIRVVGTDSSLTPLSLNTLVFNGAPNDGVVAATSLSAPSLPGPQTMSFPLKHTQLECDPNVIQAVGAALINKNVTGTWNGNLNEPGANYDGCPAQTVSLTITLTEAANHTVTGSTSNDRTITSGVRVGDTITVTLSTLFGSRGPYKWVWDSANTITGSMAYFCYDLTTGALNSEGIETFSVTRSQ